MRRLLLVLALCAPCGAFAQDTADPYAAREDLSDDERARVLFHNGANLYEEGRYEDAIAAWEEAYRLSKRPALLYNIANAQERLGQWSEALETLHRYRAFAGQDERETLERRIRNLEQRVQAMGEPARPPAPPAPPPAAHPGRRWFTVGYGLAATVAGVGGALGYGATLARAEAAALCADVGGQTLCPASAEGALARDRLMSLGADAAFGLAVVGAAGATVAGLRARSVAPVSLTGWWAPGTVGVAATFRR